MKRITVNKQDFIIESDGKNWYYRINDTLIVMPTIKDMKRCILEELNKNI